VRDGEQSAGIKCQAEEKEDDPKLEHKDLGMMAEKVRDHE
jgi:hypothetical protein